MLPLSLIHVGELGTRFHRPSFPSSLFIGEAPSRSLVCLALAPPLLHHRRFDHHQKTFQDTLSEESFKTRLSSAGLVYRHFGRRILKVLVEDSGVPDKVVDEKLYGKVYKARRGGRLVFALRVRF